MAFLYVYKNKMEIRQGEAAKERKKGLSKMFATLTSNVKWDGIEP